MGGNLVVLALKKRLITAFKKKYGRKPVQRELDDMVMAVQIFLELKDDLLG